MGRGFDLRNEFFAINNSLTSNQISRWYARLCGNEEFSQAVFTEWEKRVRPALSEIVDTEIDELIMTLGPSINMDKLCWPGKRSIFMPEASLETNVLFLESYLQERLEFLDTSFSYKKDETISFMKSQANTLPALERIEEFQLPDDTGAVSTPHSENGISDFIFSRHGIILFTLLVIILILLIAADLKRNRKIR